jgi:hypothetical protein
MFFQICMPSTVIGTSLGMTEKVPVVPDDVTICSGVWASSRASHSSIEPQPSTSTPDRSYVVSLSSQRVIRSQRLLSTSAAG